MKIWPNTSLILALAACIYVSLALRIPELEYYQIKVYHLKNDAQVQRVEDYLQKAFLPGMHKAGISNIGIFKPIQQDSSDRKIYVVVPYPSLAEIPFVEDGMFKDKKFLASAADYVNAPHNDPPFERLETILLKAFSHQPRMQTPALKGPPDQRVYELRSYEGHTEKIFQNKVKMFNEGGEVALFKRLGFNAVFYGEVIAGSRMPNLMYMTTFENQADRDAHWKAFGADAEWKKLSSMPEYQNNVSKINIHFLRPTSYSDY
jgi:hypothetical protein